MDKSYFSYWVDKSYLAYWVRGLLGTIAVCLPVYAIISLFTSMWWIGCIILFVYLWIAITIGLYKSENPQPDDSKGGA